MSLEEYKLDMLRCTRCSECKWVPLAQVKSESFAQVCPSVGKYNFHTYAAGGRLTMGLSMLIGRIDYTDEYLDILYRCQMCGGCDISCKCNKDMEPLAVAQELRVKAVEDGQLHPVHMMVIDGLRKEDNMMQGKKADRGKWAEGLDVKNITVHYHKVAAIRDISIEVEEGTIVTLIGSNGAGKSTTLRAISGLNHPTTGEIWFEGQRIDRFPPEKVNQTGIAMVPEGRRIFPQMSVMENLEMGAFLRNDTDRMREDLDGVFSHFSILKTQQKQLAGTLSGGEQQMLAMGRALMSNPSLLLMDEPSLGLSPIMVMEIAKIIKDIHEEGRTIVLVEQNARLGLGLAQKGYVLETGKIVLAGDAKDLRENKEVKKTYLGG